MITSLSCQKASKQTSKLKIKQVQTIYDHVILVSDSLQTDIEIQNEAIRKKLMITSFLCQKA